jgi:hypothetical protein
MKIEQVPSGVLNEDIEYFESKLLAESNPEARAKIKNQINALKECINIYETTKQNGKRV